MKRRSSGTNHYCPACKSPVDRVDSVCLNCEASRPPTGWPVDPYIGRIVSKKYRIDRRLSVGGFGMVFNATQVHQGQDLGPVIIKMLHPEHAFDPVVTRRFINEVKAARSINSPHVVKIFDIDFDQGNVPFMVQEFVEGAGLADILEQQGIVGHGRSVSIALQVAEGMEEAHAKDIIHRDLKPENIIIQRRGRKDFVKIIDFGIARVSTTEGINTTSFVGTPRYMPPEQIKGRVLDGRADIYALGVILFEMISGRPPIRAKDSDMEYLTLNLSKEPDRLLDHVPDAPKELDALIHRMIAKEPDDRPASMGEVVRALGRASEESGLIMDITGEHPVMTTDLDDAPTRELIKTPTFDELRERDPEKYKTHPSEDFTHERPSSVQDGRRPRLPLAAMLAGVGAFVAVVAVAIILMAVLGPPGGKGGATEEGSGTQPALEGKKHATVPPVADVAVDTWTDTASDTAAAAEPPRVAEPPVVAEPPRAAEPVEAAPPPVKPPTKKPVEKPAVIKPPKGKKTGKDPWTKI